MRICVAGLWHLGSVTAACLAARGHDVIGYDADAATVSALSEGTPPIFEPGLGDLVADGIAAGRLSFTADAAAALHGADVLWVAYDTPVDDDDHADVDAVLGHVRTLFPAVPDTLVVVVSSQVVAGTTRRLAEELRAARPEVAVSWAYSPENLRLGKAIDAFQHAERIVVGVDDAAARAALEPLVDSLAGHVEWMSVPSAELTKHALNAFLATSVTFINEVARIAELVGADAGEVERGLKSEPRIGPKAYLRPGAAIAGGTLARDVVFLEGLGGRGRRRDAAPGLDHPEQPFPLALGGAVAGARCSASSTGARVAVWGLAYTVGTDTLRRSASLELCRALAARGARRARVRSRVSRPACHRRRQRPSSRDRPWMRSHGAQALVVMTPWPEFLEVGPDALVAAMSDAIVLDPAGDVSATLGRDPRIRYLKVGVWR